jgi:Glycosyl transferase family 2
MTTWPSLVRIGTGLALLGTAHTALNAELLRRPRINDDDAPRGKVSILVPARDEAPNIAACLLSLLAQDVGPTAEIIILDDGSSDGTADIARAVAGSEPGIRIMTGQPVPEHWLGKPYACHQLAATAHSADVYVFVDADVRLAPHAVRMAVSLLDRYDLDFVSPYPRQIATGAAERIVQPLLQWSWLTFLPVRLAERVSRPSMAVANGQFLVVRRRAYERAGGHAAVRDAVLDDVALARALRRHGARGGLTDGTDLAVCRMYDGWADLRDGYAKSLWAAFGSEPGAFAVMALLAVMYVIPPIAMARGSVVGAVGYLAGVTGRMLAARRSGARVWPDPVAHPLSVLALGWLTTRSIVRRRHATLTWKGRAVGVTS